jgi:ribose 1,5-bisphosphokinase PhnN
MTELLSEQIEVKRAENRPLPLSFKWHEQEYIVETVMKEWVDAGFGLTPPGSRRWYNRRHRRYFIVKCTDGEVFEMFQDYSQKSKITWWLVKKIE